MGVLLIDHYFAIQVSIQTRIRKSYSMHDYAKKGVRRSRDLDKNRRHSLDSDAIRRGISLRDSTLDLVSDGDDNNEVYAAVSLAGRHCEMVVKVHLFIYNFIVLLQEPCREIENRII